MKDEKDKNTKDFFPDTEEGEKEKIKLLKGKNKPFQRLHIEKRIKGGTKKTTISIETLSYEFLALKLGETPHQRSKPSNKRLAKRSDENRRTGGNV